jgi:uracil-DNA glycosylase family 4
VGAKRRRQVPAYASLDEVSAEVIACRACSRLVLHRESIARAGKREFRDWTYWGKPVPGFGDPTAQFLIVGLAPAAHGANRTGRMFTGDSSGDWLYEALFRYGFASQPESTGRDDGLTLRNCFITAAGRCAPPGNKPTQDELAACRPYLEAELRLLRNVRVTLTLGHVAYRQWLRATGLWYTLAPARRPAFGHGNVHRFDDGSALVTSYHPSRQNTNTGRLTRAMWHRVFETIRGIVDAPN